MLAGKRRNNRIPIAIGPRSSGLGNITNNSQRPVERPTRHHAQLHRRKILGLVDTYVPIGADRVQRTFAWTVTQQKAGLVKQRYIFKTPDNLIGMFSTRTVQTQDLLFAERFTDSQTSRALASHRGRAADERE